MITRVEAKARRRQDKDETTTTNNAEAERLRGRCYPVSPLLLPGQSWLTVYRPLEVIADPFIISESKLVGKVSRYGGGLVAYEILKM